MDDIGNRVKILYLAKFAHFTNPHGSTHDTAATFTHINILFFSIISPMGDRTFLWTHCPYEKFSANVCIRLSNLSLVGVSVESTTYRISSVKLRCYSGKFYI